MFVPNDNMKGGDNMNGNLLMEKIKDKGIKIGFLVDSVGFSRSTFYLKVKGKCEFTAKEIKAISSVLGFSKKEIYDVFFADYVN